MKKMIMLTFVISALLLCGLNAIYAAEQVALSKTSISELQPKNETILLNDEQQKQLSELKELSSPLIGSFLYQEKIITGEVEKMNARLNIQTIKDILASCSNFDDILFEINSIQQYPDYIGGSGVTISEYWFDDSGQEKIILIHEQNEIYHEMIDNNENRIIEKIYEP